MRKLGILCLLLLATASVFAKKSDPNFDLSQNAIDAFRSNPPYGSHTNYVNYYLLMMRTGYSYGYGTQYGQQVFQVADAYLPFTPYNSEFISCTVYFYTSQPVNCAIECGARTQYPYTCDQASPYFFPDNP